MKFIYDTNDLLNFADLKRLTHSTEPDEKAEILANKMKRYFIYNKGLLYSFDKENVIYTQYDIQQDNKNLILTRICEFISMSKKNLPKKDSTKLNEYKNYPFISENSSINLYIPQLLTYLTNDNINFDDPHIMQIHFKNGYYCFETRTFRKRVENTHYVRYTIDRNYKETTEEDQKYIMSVLDKIYTNEDDRNYLLQQFGIAMSGQATNSQSILFLLGSAEMAKSTTLNLTRISFGNYYFKFEGDLFKKNNNKKHKVLNTFLKHPYIKLAHLNELDDGRMDDGFFKNFIDGDVETTSLYKDTQNSFKHFSKPVGTANRMLNIIIDTGTSRRIDAYTHTSKFTDNIDEVDVNKRIFLKDKFLIDNIAKNETQLNSFVDIIFKYANLYLTKEKIYTKTDNFRTTKDMITNSNDTVLDFKDKYLLITNEDKDRIGRDEMLEIFNESMKKHLNQLQLISQLKERGLRYDPDKRHNKIKGCFIGVKFSDDKAKNSISELDIDIMKGEQDETNKQLTDALKQIEILKTQNKELLEKLAKYEEFDTLNTDVRPKKGKINILQEPEPKTEPKPKMQIEIEPEPKLLKKDRPNLNPFAEYNTEPEPQQIEEKQEVKPPKNNINNMYRVINDEEDDNEDESIEEIDALMSSIVNKSDNVVRPYKITNNKLRIVQHTKNSIK